MDKNFRGKGTLPMVVDRKRCGTSQKIFRQTCPKFCPFCPKPGKDMSNLLISLGFPLDKTGTKLGQNDFGNVPTCPALDGAKSNV